MAHPSEQISVKRYQPTIRLITLHNLAISQKEANETQYWITLLEKTGFISGKEYNSIQKDCEEVRKMVSSIIITTKKTHNS